MRRLLPILLVALTSAHAATPLSPYADITLNTHWDNVSQTQQPEDLSKVSQKTGVKSFHLAFITDGGQCLPAWGAQPTYPMTQFPALLIEKMYKQHIKTTISFGGASGNDLSMNCSQQQLTNILNTAVTQLHACALDFDIENGTADVDKLVKAIKSFQDKNPKVQISLTLPVMPEGLTPQGESIVTTAKSYNLNFLVNVMAMDYGPAYTNNMGTYAISAAESLFAFLKTQYPTLSDNVIWQKIGLTPMIGVNDVNVEKFTLEDAKKVSSFANQKQVGLLSYWSIARDKPCTDKWASPICSGANLQSNPYDFAKAFQSSLSN